MGQIATNRRVNSKINSSLSPANQCPSKAVIIQTHQAIVNGSYTNTQCVQIGDILSNTNLITFTTQGKERVVWDAMYPLASRLNIKITYTDRDGYTEYLETYLPQGERSGSINMHYGIVSLDLVVLYTSSDSTYKYQIKFRNV